MVSKSRFKAEDNSLQIKVLLFLAVTVSMYFGEKGVCWGRGSGFGVFLDLIYALNPDTTCIF